MDEIKINPAEVFSSKYLHVFDLQPAPGRHYYDATRRTAERIVATKTDEEFKNMLPDAVSCVVVLNVKGQEPKLLMNIEYRYVTGHFLLSPPAGLLDAADEKEKEPLFATAIREIKEETGITVCEKDRLQVINPLLFSSPGMTDESNALVLVVLNRDEEPEFSQEGCESTEKFDGVKLLSIEEAKKVLKNGRDENGVFYSVYTWMALTYFAAELWK